MKAIQANLLTFLHANQQLCIPIYQRNYSWLEAECDQLWKDIVRAGRDESTPSHFVGALVYLAPNAAPLATEPQMRLVIDGQQRLTTITLLLAALRDTLEQAGDDSSAVSPDQIHHQFLTNQYAAPSKRAKLVLTGKDNATLERIIARLPLDDALAATLSGVVSDNYRHFRSKLKAGETTALEVFGGIEKLMIVEVSLERGIDDPQLIFESLNSTGRDLSQADLIRNFILMRMEPEAQQQLYLKHWLPMEQAFLQTEDGAVKDFYPQWFDWFVRDYLTLKSEIGAIPKIGYVYDAFKEFARNSALSLSEIVADLHHFALHYVRLGLGKGENDTALAALYHDINNLEVDVAYPFLMRVLNDYETQKISHNEFCCVLQVVESYVFRRSVCGIPTNSLNKTFATLYRSARPDRAGTGADYVAAIACYLADLDSYRRFPRNDEFRRELEIKDVYHTRNCNYLLGKLENFNAHEKILVADSKITIEHILPQSEVLRPEWIAMLGENWEQTRERWLHTLGNLTLTGYNSNFSDKPFEEKRDLALDGQQVGLGSGRFRLNEDVRDLETWDEAAIAARARRLSERAVTVWPFPPEASK